MRVKRIEFFSGKFQRDIFLHLNSETIKNLCTGTLNFILNWHFEKKFIINKIKH